MTAYLHWLLLANGLALLCCVTVAVVCEEHTGKGLTLNGAIGMATIFVSLTFLNLVAAGAVWP